MPLRYGARVTTTDADTGEVVRKALILALCLTGAPPAFAQQKCFVLLGERTFENGQWVPNKSADRGTALINVAPGASSVHLWFERTGKWYDQMAGGAEFNAISAKMDRDQGVRPATNDAAGIHFDNGFKANYTLKVTSLTITGTIQNPQGKFLSAEGRCLKDGSETVTE